MNPGTAGKYVEIFRVNLLSTWAYVHDQLLRSIFLVVVMFVFLQLWQTTYATMGVSDIDGFSISDMLWYLVFAEALTMAIPRVSSQIALEVRTGDIAYRLNKPFNYAGYYYALYWAEFLPRLLVNLVVGGVVVWVALGPPPITLASIGAFAAATFLGQSLSFVFSYAVGICAFWIEDTEPVYLLYSRLVMLLGGTLLPLEVFPMVVRRVALVLPFRHMVYGPARLLVGGDAQAWLAIAQQQVPWIIGSTVVASALFTVGARRLNIHGG